MDILEIQEMIFMYLSQRERSKIKRVCKSFRDMCDSIWERLYHKQKPVKQIWFENHILLKNDKRSFLSRKRNLRIRTPKLFDSEKGLFFYVVHTEDIALFVIESRKGRALSFPLHIQSQKKLYYSFHYLDQINTILLHSWTNKRSSFDISKSWEFKIKLKKLPLVKIKKMKDLIEFDLLMFNYSPNEQKKCHQCGVLEEYRITDNQRVEFPLVFQLDKDLFITVPKNLNCSLTSGWKIASLNFQKSRGIQYFTLLSLNSLKLLKLDLSDSIRWYQIVIDRTNKIVTFNYRMDLDDVNWVKNCPIENKLILIKHQLIIVHKTTIYAMY
jgi:hypothetical protein